MENKPGALVVTAEAIQIKPVVVTPILAAPMLLLLGLLVLLFGGKGNGTKIMEKHRRQRDEQ